MTSPLLQLGRVTKRFGRVVIAEQLSLSVDAGDTVGIVGPNGAARPAYSASSPATCLQAPGRSPSPAARSPSWIGGAVQAGHRAQLSGAAPVHGHDRVREPAGRRAAGRRAAAPGQLRGDRASTRLDRHDRTGQPARRAAWPAPAQAARAGSRPRVPAQAAAAGRGSWRPDRPGGRPARRDRPRGQRRGHRGDLDRARSPRAHPGGERAALPRRRQVRRRRHPR